MNKISLHIEREGQILADLGWYNTLADAKEQADSIGVLYEGCEVVAYDINNNVWLLTDDWEDITENFDGQPTWEQEWEDFGEVYSDEYNSI